MFTKVTRQVLEDWPHIRGKSRRLFEWLPESERGSRLVPWLTLTGDFTRCCGRSGRETKNQPLIRRDHNVDKLGWLMDIAAESDWIIAIAHRHSSAQQILVEKDDFVAENRMNVASHNR